MPTFSVWKSGTWVEYTLPAAIDHLRLDHGVRGPALPGITGDFDNGIGKAPDGAYINRPDDGGLASSKVGRLPYFDPVSQTGETVPPTTLYAFSPQRLLPSPVQFGSLPTGTRAQVPWQTLLFRPQPQHFGARTPPDHLLLDLFFAPVLEPEMITHDFETEGKVNLNHQVLPFTHIKRATALHAVMKAETIMVIPDEASASYKTGSQPDDRFRRYTDAARTIDLWDDRTFLTESQLCEHYLVPEGLFATGEKPASVRMEEFWKEHRVTGDNSKEQPYARLYPRLTTRSNVFRVHVIAQSLKKARRTDPASFDSRRDAILATSRSSAILSRRLDTHHQDLPDFQIAPETGQPKPLSSFYRWHVRTLNAW